MNSQALVVMTSAAFVGGVISIAMRWREFAQVRDVYPFARFVTVMFKPLIGVGLSVFILAALESRVVTLAIFDNNGFTAIDSAEFKTYYRESVAAALGGQTAPSATTASSATLDAATKTAGYKTLYLLWVLGFLAGFSERFAGDFVDRTASIAGGKEDAAKNRPT